MATAPDEPEEVDPSEVELLEEEVEQLEEEITDPAIKKEVLLAGLGEPAPSKLNPFATVRQAARENPEALDALLDGLRMPSTPPDPPRYVPPPEPARSDGHSYIPPVLDPEGTREREAEEAEEEEEAFYRRFTDPPDPPKSRTG